MEKVEIRYTTKPWPSWALEKTPAEIRAFWGRRIKPHASKFEEKCMAGRG